MLASCDRCFTSFCGLVRQPESPALWPINNPTNRALGLLFHVRATYSMKPIWTQWMQNTAWPCTSPKLFYTVLPLVFALWLSSAWVFPSPVPNLSVPASTPYPVYLFSVCICCLDKYVPPTAGICTVYCLFIETGLLHRAHHIWWMSYCAWLWKNWACSNVQRTKVERFPVLVHSGAPLPCGNVSYKVIHVHW